MLREHMMNAIRSPSLGLDPGLRRTGWGVVSVRGLAPDARRPRRHRPDEKAAFAERLLRLFEGICAVIEQHRPDEAAVEETFVNTNAQSTLKLGHARAAALIAPARAGLPVAEYSNAHGQEGGGRHGRRRQGPDRLHDRPPAAHRRQDHRRRADALAVAITHAHARTARRVA
jgi:crossover junction endodeoxyribonuclease RuvC